MSLLANEYLLRLPSRSMGSIKAPDAVRLDLCEMPYPPAPGVIAAVKRAVSSINRYPVAGAPTLREKIAEYSGVAPDEVFIGNGSDDIIELIIKVFVSKGDHVIIPFPTFFVYEMSTILMGAEPIYIPRDADYNLDINRILENIGKNTKLIFIASPNNPTGNSVSRIALQELLHGIAIVNEKCIVVVDECYFEMSGQTALNLLKTHPNLVIMRSFSKSFGLAGLRVGYALAERDLIKSLNNSSQLFAVNALAQVAAVAALEDINYMQRRTKQVITSRQSLVQKLCDLNFQCFPSDTNFILVRTKGIGLTSKEIVDGLAKNNIFVQDVGSRRGLDAYFFRTAVGTRPQNHRLIESLCHLTE